VWSRLDTVPTGWAAATIVTGGRGYPAVAAPEPGTGYRYLPTGVLWHRTVPSMEWSLAHAINPKA
jgi:hypothetical protein